jgi:UDP-N-acetylmuramoyl-tripeptide--D-alanyl-D-alanine ligase
MMSLSAAARALDARLTGADAEFFAVTSDTRVLKRGDLFVALVGPNFDGHAFLSEAQTKGAAGALVSRKQPTTLPTIMLEDTRIGLGRLAAHWRAQFSIPLVAVTGSNGKTTVKNMLASILAESGAGLATQGNLNNDIGVPLTLLRLKRGDRYAVIEMGMNHPGEIDYLTHLARPTVALITNAGEAHLAGLGSVAAVARAKGEIFSGLKQDGIAVINADDAYAGLWQQLAAPHRCLTFGMDHPADVSAECTLAITGSVVRLKTPQGGIEMRLSLLGKHNVMNALAAASASIAAGVKLDDIKNGLEKLKAMSGRLEIKPGIKGARILDDTYNANPSSLVAGVEVLKEAEGERVLVLGDMAELGDAAADIHRRVGEIARRLGVHRLFAVGELSKSAVAGFGDGAQHYPSQQALVEDLLSCIHPGMTVLVKGSRVMRMEKVVGQIIADAAGRNN